MSQRKHIETMFFSVFPQRLCASAVDFLFFHSL